MNLRLASVLGVIAATMAVSGHAQIVRAPDFPPVQSLAIEHRIGMLKAQVARSRGIIAQQQASGHGDPQAIDDAGAAIGQAETRIAQAYRMYRAYGGHKPLDRIAPVGNGMPAAPQAGP